ncbi:GIY-YIG nuclease family protein [Streptomyces sp. NPDC056231]|uniref:GIY-YIG nuclease family protein n=1 Tax=Streptomyces sp. NPDC056231 TaxID=3345755 RepID=UPI003AAF7F98
MNRTAQQTSNEVRPAAVYRLFAKDGTLLYVGSAYDPEERARAHQRKDWWPLVARRTDEWHDTREDADNAESRVIVEEDPAHNVAGTPRNTGPAERGKIQREASDARWRVAIAAVRAGASVTQARCAGGWAEVEYLEASGVLPKMAAKYPREMVEEGGTYNSRNMSLPGYCRGRLTWEMRPRELRAAGAAGVLGNAYPPPQRTGRNNG